MVLVGVSSDSLRNGGSRIQKDRCAHLVTDSPFLHRLSDIAQKAVSLPTPKGTSVKNELQTGAWRHCNPGSREAETQKEHKFEASLVSS